MKKGLIYILTIIILFSSFIYVISKKSIKNSNTDKIKVIATLFPQYDFIKQIGGDKVEVTLLLPPGTETHTYEPTPKDIININNSDLFVYTGKYMEPWAETITSSIDSNTKIVDVSKNINLINEENFEKDNEHNIEIMNEESKTNTNEPLQSSSDIQTSHEHEYDPHIWLNPQNAIKMVENITLELCKIDPINKSYYEKNSENYINEIKKLDNEIEQTVKKSSKNKIAFGGTFAYAYFIERYNIQYISAYDSCGENSEPSVSKIKQVIDFMKANNLNVIFYQELSSGKVADTISSETAAKKLIFHTIHNATQKEIEEGQTYITLMKQNHENLKEALND